MNKLLFILPFLVTSVFGIGISDYETSQIEITPLGQGTHLKVGRYTEIGKFRVKNNSNKKVVIQSITFRNYGKSNLKKSLENAKLVVNNEPVSTDFEARGSYITFLFNNGLTGGFILPAGDSNIFTIKANIVYARTGDSIELGLKNTEDFVATEAGTGFQSTLNTTPRLATYTLNPGSYNFQRNPSLIYRGKRSRQRKNIGVIRY
ncbi:hypothetical protein K9M41_03320 [Candidatus Gracilibacteria bacterium]|nr:hypothetical protein [Candidatus Gracilibacteria bacterium]